LAKRMTISIEPALKSRLEHYSKTISKSQSDIIGEALDMYLQIEQGLYDYNEPALTRLNQMTDAFVGLREEQQKTVETMSRVETLLFRYMNGENYYNEEGDM